MHGLIFAGLGPLIGFAVVLVAGELNGGYLFSGPTMGVVKGMMMLIPFAYIFGLIPAFVAAGAVRLIQVRAMKHEWLWVGFAGIAIGLIFEVAFAKVLSLLTGSLGGEVSYFRPQALLVYGLACLIPTLVCWRLSRRFDRSFQPSRGRGARL